MAEPTKEEIKKAIKEKHCPYCKGEDFVAVFEIFEKDFVFNKDGETDWGNTGEQEIRYVECHICGEEVPEEVWSEWGIKEISEVNKQ